jgi:hypothetical protein
MVRSSHHARRPDCRCKVTGASAPRLAHHLDPWAEVAVEIMTGTAHNSDGIPWNPDNLKRPAPAFDKWSGRASVDFMEKGALEAIPSRPWAASPSPARVDHQGHALVISYVLLCVGLVEQERNTSPISLNKLRRVSDWVKQLEESLSPENVQRAATAAEQAARRLFMS